MQKITGKQPLTPTCFTCGWMNLCPYKKIAQCGILRHVTGSAPILFVKKEFIPARLKKEVMELSKLWNIQRLN